MDPAAVRQFAVDRNSSTTIESEPCRAPKHVLGALQPTEIGLSLLDVGSERLDSFAKPVLSEHEAQTA